MTGPHRLAKGGQVHRDRPLRFTFDGRALTGFEGDTLASALLASGVSVVGRGFKFHRPRGILSAGLEEPNALVTVGVGARREPSVRATAQPLFDGLIAESQNRWPSLSFDVGRVNDYLHRLFAAGFYNKTFIWPSWHTFEPLIRRMAGLGVAPDEPDPDCYEWRNAHCDVLVIGGGASGLLAAWIAARSGARVLLVESDRTLGGGWNWERSPANGLPPEQRICQAIADLAAQDAATPNSTGPTVSHSEHGGAQVRHSPLASLPGMRILLNTTAVGMYDHGFVTAVEKQPHPIATSSTWRERWWRIRAKHVILATGAFEQPLAFPFNDRPGVMLADATRHYLNRYAVAAGKRVVVATNNDSAYQVASDLHAAGIKVPCLLDTRPNPSPDLVQAMSDIGIDVLRTARIASTSGDRRIASLELVSGVRVMCDALAMSGGWNPVAHLYCQSGGRLRFDAHHACLVPDGRLDNVHAVGAAAAMFDPHTAMEHVRTTLGQILKSQPDIPPWAQYTPSRERRATGALGYSAETRRNRTWLDFQHDVTVSDIDLSVRENLVSVEHVKRYTTVGMSVDQGKTSNLNALAVLAERTHRSIPEVGTTTFRPFFVPVTLGTLAGGRTARFYRPMRYLPAHPLHEALGAHFLDYGGWQRPAYYPLANETEAAALRREVLAVRTATGLIEASPLGKFLVRGPDAAEFLDRIYANTVSTLEPGKIRYGLMLNEQGVIIDDGVCTRLCADEFWVSSSSSGAVRIGAWLEEWLQGEWSHLQVVITDLTSAFATLTLAGPKAREVLQTLPGTFDLSRAAFPHMQVRDGELCGMACRILRVSFTGELSYEINVPADYGAALWERIHTAGQPFGLTPLGIESLLVARVEKGYLHVGADTDGSTIPDDVGFGVPVSKKKSDFIGRRSLSLAENLRPDRLQLVGLRCTGDPQAFHAGAHLLDARATQHAQSSAGYLTSACLSPTLDQRVGLGLLKNGRACLGQRVRLFDKGLYSEAEVVPPSHYDAAGERLNV